MVTQLSMRENDTSVYGDFPDQLILGYKCTISVKELPDNHPDAIDELGIPIQRGDIAIHVSGKNEFGELAMPGEIVHIGRMHHDWHGAKNPPCATEGPVAIYIDPAEFQGFHNRMHHALFSSTNSLFTYRGIMNAMQKHIASWGTKEVMAAVALYKASVGKRNYLKGKQHEQAVRRLLDRCLGRDVEINGRKMRIERSGRWQYLTI